MLNQNDLFCKSRLILYLLCFINCPLTRLLCFSINKILLVRLLNCAPTHLTHYWYAPYASACLRALPIINTHLSALRACAPLLTNKRLTRLFLSCVVVSIVRCGLRLKNPRKATGLDFIPLKVIKFALNVIDFHLYNIIIKDLEKNKYSEEPKTVLVIHIFKKNERNRQDKKL